jgi:GNAT superfamily N-acetyltransferase
MMQTTTHWQIRKGGSNDFEHAIELIKELARFENAADEVISSAESLKSDWESEWFDFLIAEDSNAQVVGMALFHKAYSTWKGKMLYLDDIVVKESFRGRGIGSALMHALHKEAILCGASLLKWQVLDWNKSALKLYDKLGATVETNWWNCKWAIDSSLLDKHQP